MVIAMSEIWLVPANPKVYDVVEHFTKHETIIWRNMFSIQKGDVVYLYFGNPLRQIKYKCIVTSCEIDEKTLNENNYAVSKKKNFNYFSKKEKYIELRPILKFPDGCLTYTDLKEHGLGQVQIQARIDRRVKKYINEIEEYLRTKGGGDDA